MAVEDTEANGFPMEETKVMSDEKVPQVKVASNSSATKEKKDEFEGLTKEELMKYADDPKWVRVRWALFILFWLIWLAMLVASILIIIYAPKCPSPQPKQWWQKSPAYKVDIAAFKDSDGDGTGDIKGLTEELPYIAGLDVPSIEISPFYPGTVEGGSGASDLMSVDPSLGDLNDWIAMVKKVHEHGIKVVVDMMLDVTSTDHIWFQDSVARKQPYEDFYLWQDQEAEGYQLNSARGQAYKLGSNGLPQLDLSNPKVVSELEKVLTFWMDHGVAGFNLLHINTYTTQFSSTAKLIKQLRNVAATGNKVQEIEQEESVVLISVSAEDTLTDPGMYYGSPVSKEHVGDLLHLVGSGNLLDNVQTAQVGTIDANSVISYINTSLHSRPENAWPVFTLSKEDSRVADTFPHLVDPMNMLTAVLPATTFTHYGDELGLVSGKMNWEMAANQTTATSEDRHTHLGLFQKLSQLRTQKTILFGTLDIREVEGCVVVSRVKKGNPGYLLVINLTDKTVQVDASKVPNIADNVRLEVESTYGKEFSKRPQDIKSVANNELVLQAKQAIIYTFVPSFKE